MRFQRVYFFDSSLAFGVEGQGQTLKTLKSIISNTERDRKVRLT